MQSNESNIVERLYLLLEQNLDKPRYSIDEICLELAISHSQLFCFIKEQTNLSPSRFIRLKRLTKGKQLLENGSLRIVEISVLTGFDSQQTFSRYFTEEFSVSLTDYRKNRESIVKNIEQTLPEPIELVGEPATVRQKNPTKISCKKYIYLALVLVTNDFSSQNH